MTDKRFIEQFEENVRLYPDKVILRDEHHSLTFRELDELSGRVYAYLKEKGIGREDFVMIDLPHTCLVYACMIGVWRAGAAFVVTGEGLPSERSKFVYKECDCRINLNEEQLLLIQNISPNLGHESTDVHDIAYAVYTSGSEGTPKGSLLEYGFLEFFAQTALNTSLIEVREDTTYFMPVPMFTVGAVNTCIQIIWSAITVDIGPLGIMRDVKAFEKYLNEHRVNVAFMPPSYFKNYNISTPYLECVILTSEKASNVYSTHCKLLNTYTQTEGYHLCWFKINKSYENTPIGQPVSDKIHIALLDDDGNEVPHGEKGELCFERKFFRGYVGETKYLHLSRWQHSGDIARINEDGNYVILGRKSDMIKINGNRIEPAEIEAAVKKVLGIDWVFAKGFVEPERSYIAVYYTAPIDIDYSRTHEELLKILPTYMIPSYFVHIDEIPHLPNGKIDRQALKAPDIEQYRAPYVAPENELEARLCQEMEQILFATSPLAPLGERGWGIGVLDDFYLLGGDSLRTIELVTKLDIEGLTVTDIYAARTPRAIAERWMQKMIAE